MRKNRTVITAMALGLLMLGAPPASAQTQSPKDPLADPSDDVIVVDINHNSSSETSLVINVDSLGEKDRKMVIGEIKKIARDSVKLKRAREVVKEQSASLNSLSIASTVGGTGASLGRAIVTGYPSQSIYCNQEKLYIDSNISLRVRNNCQFNVVNWDFTITPSVRSIIASPVNERGMDWWYNGRQMSRNARHIGYSKYYLFHGTLKPAKAPATVRMSDYLTFTVKIGSKRLAGSIYVCKTVYPKR